MRMSKLVQAMIHSREDTYLFMVKRYPRLVRRMKWVAILSDCEAGAALRDYVYARDGMIARDLMVYGGGEAVCHFGGPMKVIQRAIKGRNVWR